MCLCSLQSYGATSIKDGVFIHSLDWYQQQQRLPSLPLPHRRCCSCHTPDRHHHYRHHHHQHHHHHHRHQFYQYHHRPHKPNPQLNNSTSALISLVLISLLCFESSLLLPLSSKFSARNDKHTFHEFQLVMMVMVILTMTTFIVEHIIVGVLVHLLLDSLQVFFPTHHLLS